ncbi:serine/threonine/tyrosine-interacting-like protein 2 [Pantherophis guttatus]|uniref:Serine/threonine/tyrosine-interacting-like protein 2 n=1 Tax=Pantherophis guttatus TaxID=94885 RepID=A0A6P9BGL6_PANGU|nr:serine/threonine/tyrosine-interacting-like protein 2 [Pantherophis guttatus]
MASSMDSGRDQEVPDGEEPDVKAVQAHYLRSPSPSRFSVLSDAETESIFMEPIHLSSAVAAKQIIKEELKTKEVKVDTVCPGMLESAEQLLMEDLYNRVKEKIDDTSLFNTPCVMDIQRALMKDYLESPREAIDEVWPNIFIAEKSAAVNKGRLKRLGITHILNAAHGTGVYTGPDFYNGMNIQYLGIEVDDFPDEEIAKHFRPAAEFLDEALLTCRGKVLVSSEMGVSRSAVLVSAYLMIFHHMTILEALLTIRKKRAIYPNDGFLKQLRELNEKLLEEREEEEDSEDTTDDQSSVVRAGSCSLLSETEDSKSIVGAKVHSIIVEEEDTTSLLGSAMSASSMGKLSLFSKEPTLISEEEEEELYEEWRRKQGLPDKEILKKKEESKASDLSLQGQVESEENVDQMIQAWQCQNEKYQMENYMFSKEEEASMGQKSCLVNDTTDTESVSSQEIRTLKQQLEASSINRMRRGRTDSMSTESSWDMWNERMMEIEKEASKKYCSKARYSDENLKSENGTRERDIDTESVLSDASSFYNFCQKNKDKLTALERWKIKRIQFGFHKKDSEVEQSKAGDGSQQNKESMEEEKSLSDINMTAYQAWKTKHQKKVGSENKDDIVELTKGEDSTCARRKQRRMELLEHSKKLLEESQSLCSWEAETSMSGSIPLSAFWPSTASVNGIEDSASAISMQTNRSTFSQARSSHGAKSASVPGPSIGPDETISIASIQNWIANVVNETIAQKQNEILMLSRSPSVLSSSVKSGDPNRHGENDRSSLLKAQIGLPLSSSTSLLHQDPQYADTQSILSCNTSVSMGDSVSTRKVTQTSKPLFSLFADEVDLKKLSRKEREMQTEMREKMSDYQMEKLISDNKRSTLFKKKKIKGDDEDEKRENLYDRSIENVNGGPRHSLTDDNNSSDIALSGQFANVGGVIRSEVENNVNKWLIGLKTEEKPSYQDCTEASSEKYRNSSTFRKVNTEASSYRSSRSQREEMNSSATHQYKNKLQRTSSQFSSASAQEEKAYTFTESKVSEINSTEESPEPCSSRTPKSSYSSESSKPSTRSYHLEEHEEESRLDMTESGAKRKFTQSFAKSEEGTEKEENMEESKEYISSKYLIRNRQSTRKEEEEMDDDAIIAAWRSRQAETKAKLQRRREE